MNTRSWLLAAAVLMTLIAGCGKKNDDKSETGSGAAPFPTAATLGDQVVLTAAEYLETEPYASANRSKAGRSIASSKR